MPETLKEFNVMQPPVEITKKDRLKVLIVTPDINKSGGVANYYKILSRSFTHDVEYFTMGSRTDKDGWLNDIKRIFADYRQFKQKIQQDNYDLIVINPTLDMKAVLRDAKFISIVLKHSKAKLVVFWRGFYLNFFDKYIKSRFKNSFAKYFFKADAHIVLGTVFQERLRSIGYTGPVFCETTIVDENFIRNTPKHLDLQSLNILFLARIEKEKGIYEAIDAFKIIKEKYPQALLTVSGNGFELENAKAYVESNKIAGVNFTGDVRDQAKKDVFEKADIYLFPSYHEGMPNSVLEAMGMGLPVVTRNVGGLKDFFVNGQMGYITDSYNPADFASLIDNVYSDGENRKKITILNTAYAEKNFLRANVINRLEKIFETVCK